MLKQIIKRVVFHYVVPTAAAAWFYAMMLGEWPNASVLLAIWIGVTAANALQQTGGYQ